jgi:transglutaminase-like putative cysteine protease
MWVSDLNSAYFIYNPAGNKQLETFQQLRFDQLRNSNTYEKLDKKFMDYYTFMPKNEEYNRISELAKQITKDAKTPVDKMIAIRNYFTGKMNLDNPLFRYSDNPGIPGLPSASKLNYFLFENRKGYCAYFAGATLFLLRSLGIPSRIAAGFLTVDRSSKNPGWYWFYADQAHAWVQLYFEGYGWIDFDTTVPDQNTQQSPQPDGTPTNEYPTGLTGCRWKGINNRYCCKKGDNESK